MGTTWASPTPQHQLLTYPTTQITTYDEDNLSSSSLSSSPSKRDKRLEAYVLGRHNSGAKCRDRSDSEVLLMFRFWDDLPEELKFRILTFLTPGDLVKLQLVSSHIYRILDDELLWKEVFLKCNYAYQLCAFDAPPKSWRKACLRVFYLGQGKEGYLVCSEAGSNPAACWVVLHDCILAWWKSQDAYWADLTRQHYEGHVIINRQSTIKVLTPDQFILTGGNISYPRANLTFTFAQGGFASSLYDWIVFLEQTIAFLDDDEPQVKAEARLA